jgi:hypothetical protein
MLGDTDTHKLERLSRYSRKPVAELDALLPSLRWEQQGSLYVVARDLTKRMTDFLPCRVHQI